MDEHAKKLWNQSGFTITDFPPSHRQFRLDEALTEDDISKALGIQPKRRRRGGKVTREWTFYAEKRYVVGDKIASVSTGCRIWDFSGSRWSAYGFPEAFEQVGLTPLMTKDYGDWQYEEDGNPTIAVLTGAQPL